jgi:hypothetical protein
MARRRMDKIRRADRTYYFIRPPDEPSAPRRRVRVKIDYDRELRDLANKAAAYSEMLEGCNVADVSANSANDALKHVQHAIAYLRKFERRLMKCVDERS